MVKKCINIIQMNASRPVKYFFSIIHSLLFTSLRLLTSIYVALCNRNSTIIKTPKNNKKYFREKYIYYALFNF